MPPCPAARIALRMLALAALTAVPVAAAAAEGWATRPGDSRFGAEELAAFLATHEVRFYDGGQSFYGPGDAYAYVYDGGYRAEGRYRIEADGSVCVAFENGFSRCDLYVRAGSRVLVIDQKGDRYPLR